MLAELAKLPLESGAVSVALEAESETDVEQVLEEVRLQLEDFDTAAEQGIERLLHVVKDGALRDALKRAQRALEQYDFDQAIEELESPEKQA